MEDTKHVDSGEQDELLSHYQKETDFAIKKWKKPLARIRKNQRLMRGSANPDKESDPDAEAKVRANLIYSVSRTILPSIYAQNPEVQVKPAARAGTEGQLYFYAKNFAETLEIMVNHEFKKAEIKKKHKRTVRSAQTSRVGLLKVAFQRDLYTDPQTKQRIEDSQDDLNDLNSRINELETAKLSSEEEERNAAELVDLIKSLEDQKDIMRSQGTVIDVVSINNFLMDPSVDSLEDYLQAKWMQDRSWVPVVQFKRKYNLTDEDIEEGNITVYHQPENSDTKSEWGNRAEGERLKDGWVAVWERWNKPTNTIYTWAAGAKEFLKAPYQPEITSDRWYPYFMFGLHWVDGLEWPQGDPEQLEKLSDEFNNTREMQAEHRAASVPYLVVAGSALAPEEVRKIEVAEGLDIVVLDIEGKSIRDLVQDGPTPTYNPAMYDTVGIHQDIGLVSGATDAAKGAVVRNKTLGEAEIMQSHLASRLGDMQDDSEDFLQEIAEHVAQIILQEYKAEEVQKIVGQNAVWPEMDKWEVYNLVSVEIKAGSTGKPDKRRDLMQWTEMLPMIIQLIQFGMQFRQQTGGDDASNPFFNILEISFKKFDERLDMESILPPQQQTGAMGGQGAPGMPQEFGMPQQPGQEQQQMTPEQQAILQAIMQQQGQQQPQGVPQQGVVPPQFQQQQGVIPQAQQIAVENQAIPR